MSTVRHLRAAMGARRTVRSLSKEAPVLVGAAAGAAFLVRYLSWPSAASFDAWAYSSWGHSLLSGEAPAFDLSSTTPKPLVSLLSGAVAAVPAPHGVAVLVIGGLAVTVGCVYALASRNAGPLAGAAAAVALVVGGGLDSILSLVHVDAMTSALVAAGLVASPRMRLALFVGAGLLRPEAWLLAGVAAYLQTDGSAARRLGHGVATALVAPFLWMLHDLVLMGDVFGTIHWTEATRARRDALGFPLPEVTPVGGFVSKTLLRDLGASIVTVAGLVGLALSARRRRTRGDGPGPGTVALVWAAGLLAGTVAGLDPVPRYLLPAVAMLAVGCGVVVGALPGPPRLPQRVAAAGAIACIAAVTSTMDVDPRLGFQGKVAAVRSALPGVEMLLRCDDVAVAANFRSRHFIPMLAAPLRVAPTRFAPIEGSYDEVRGEFDRYAAVIRAFKRATPLPDWELFRSGFGTVAVRRDCPEPRGWEPIAATPRNRGLEDDLSPPAGREPTVGLPGPDRMQRP